MKLFSAFNDFTNKLCRINVVRTANSMFRYTNFNDLVYTGEPISGHSYIPVISVTDRGVRVCANPWGNGATMNAGGEEGPGPPGRGEGKQLVPNSGDG